MIKAVAFDLDDTLIDFISMKKKTASEAAKAMISNGLDSNVEKLYKEIFSVYDEHGLEYQKTFSTVLGKYDLEPNKFEKIQQAAIIAYLKTKFSVMQSYPGVIDELKKLKTKYKLAVITDAPRNKAWQRLVLCGLQDMFDLVVTYDDTMERKPGELPFKELLKQLEMQPEEVMMIGDSYERDVKGAESVGMKCALVEKGRLRELNIGRR